jgi:hypothetical protein
VLNLSCAGKVNYGISVRKRHFYKSTEKKSVVEKCGLREMTRLWSASSDPQENKYGFQVIE